MHQYLSYLYIPQLLILLFCFSVKMRIIGSHKAGRKDCAAPVLDKKLKKGEWHYLPCER